MNKIKASVVVIGYQKEDKKMYPHLYDFLQNMRSYYDEVIYLDDDDSGKGLYGFDTMLQIYFSLRGLKSLWKKLRINLFRFLRREGGVLNGSVINGATISERETVSDPPTLRTVGKDIVTKLTGFFLFLLKQKSLSKKLQHLSLQNRRSFLIAIDHTAAYLAGKYFPGMIIFWSYDIPTKDYQQAYHIRIKNGLYEKLITSKDALRAETLLIQDEKRRKLLDESLDVSFKNVIYLPVGLNDSDFCKEASKKRLRRNFTLTVTVIQIGAIGHGRRSDTLIASYQNWTDNYELTLHGFISNEIYDILSKVKKKPVISKAMYDNVSFPQFLDKYDIGFVGYGERNNNYRYIENASSQLVAFLRLGMPVIACGSDLFNNFVNKNNIGIGIFSFEEMEVEIKKIVDNYAFFSHNARNLYESRFDLTHIFQSYLIKSFEAIGL